MTDNILIIYNHSNKNKFSLSTTVFPGCDGYAWISAGICRWIQQTGPLNIPHIYYWGWEAFYEGQGVHREL